MDQQIRLLQLEMARRAAVAGVFSFIGFLVFYYVTPFPTGRPFGIDVAYASMALSAVLRGLVYWLELRYLPDPSSDERWLSRTRLLFRIVILISAATWGLLAVPTVLQYGTAPQAFIILAIEPGIALLGLQNFGFDLKLLRAFIITVMAPGMLTLFALRSAGAFTVGCAYLIYTAFLLFLGNRANALLWEAFASRTIIQRQRDQLTAVLDAFPGFIFWLDPAGKILGLNKELPRAYQGQPADFLAKPLDEATRDAALCDAVREFRDSNRSEELVEMQLCGPAAPCWTLLALKKYGEAAEQHVLAIGLDISERKRAELERDQAQASAYQSSQLAELGVMAAGIAHEINNPLQALSFSLGLLQQRLATPSLPRQELTAQGLRLVTRAKGTVQRIAAIVHALRSFAHKEPTADVEVVHVREVLEELRELAAATVPKDALDLQIDLPADDLTLRARRVQIGQVLLNLFNNARDAIAAAPERWIHICARDLGSDVELTVEDSGSGIEPPLRDQIMVPFFTTKRAGRGTGLGLSISKTIVEQHHGKFFLDTAAAHTRFVVVLPKNDAAPS